MTTNTYIGDEEISDQVRRFILTFARRRDLTDETDIFETGLITSMFAMQLLMFIEKTFGITIDNEDLTINNFNTVKHITDLLKRKVSS